MAKTTKEQVVKFNEKCHNEEESEIFKETAGK